MVTKCKSKLEQFIYAINTLFFQSQWCELEHQTCNLDFIHSSSSPCLSLVFLLVTQSLTQLGSMLVCIYLNYLFHILFTLVLQAPFKEGWRGLGGDKGCQTVGIRIVFWFSNTFRFGTKAVTIEKENRKLHVSPHNHPIY